MYRITSNQGAGANHIELKLEGCQYFDTLHLHHTGDFITQLKQAQGERLLDLTQSDSDSASVDTITPTLIRARQAVQDLYSQLQDCPNLTLDPIHLSESSALQMEPADSLAEAAAMPNWVADLEPLLIGAGHDPDDLLGQKDRYLFNHSIHFSKLWATTRAVCLVALTVPLLYGSYQFCRSRSLCDVATLGQLWPFSSSLSARSAADPAPAPAIAEVQSRPAKTQQPAVPSAIATQGEQLALAQSPGSELEDLPAPRVLPVDPVVPAAVVSDEAIAALTADRAFYDAVTYASEAASQVQQATTASDWQAVAATWLKALGAMHTVPASHANYPIAQQKIYEYSGYLTYAQHNALNTNAHLEFRQAVQAATQAAALTQSAQAAAEWQQVAALWEQAIAQMQAIPASSTYFAIATAKVDEYSKNLAYASRHW